MKTKGFASQHCNVISVLLIIFVTNIFQSTQAQTQVRAGLGYLKMLPGTRELGVAGTLTGALDYSYSFHANPAATGFLREWQWSATYTKWISDLYNASFLYGKRVNTLWSRQTRFALGINYLGIPEFDSSNETAAPASGNNLLVTASMGQPLTMVSPHISIGANVKYFNSKLAQFEAQSFIFDYGLLFRTERLSLMKPGTGLLDYAIFSAGLAITNSGNSIQYISEGTPLPKTLRAGIALNLGAHNGLQLNLGTDYRQVRDEDGFVTFGSEVSWNQFISMRMGYSLEENILGHYTFGASLRLDDGIIKNFIPGRNNAVRFDFTANQNNELVASPYHGSVTFLPIGPDNFKLTDPSRNAQIDVDGVTLKWQDSHDPDLFDDIRYWLLLDTDSTKIARIIGIADQQEDELFTFLKNCNDLLVNQPLEQTFFKLNELNSGDYYWAVFSYDKDNHFRFAEMNNDHVAHFKITAPDPRIKSIHFDYSPWITQDDYQGKLQIVITNLGTRAAKNFSLLVYDSLTVQLADHNFSNIDIAHNKKLLSTTILPSIQPLAIDTVEFGWRTDQPGKHHIVAEIVDQNSNFETAKVNNRFDNSFYTIPKGTIVTNDTASVLNLNRITYELPYVGKVFFNSNSSAVDKKFVRQWIMSPPLTTFAERALNDANLMIYLKGSADLNSGEDAMIARKRALAVRDTLLNLGVKSEQITVLSDTVLLNYRLPQKEEDVRWILEDKKYVEILADISTEDELFGPLQNTVDEEIASPLSFQANISGVVPFTQGMISVTSGDLFDTLSVKDLTDRRRVAQSIDWYPPRINQDNWLEKNVNYTIQLKDTLGRQFQSYNQKVFLKKEIVGKEKMYYVIAKFAKAKELYHFYWSNLLDRIPFLLKDDKTRMRFIGHGCAIGPESINQSLSEKRAKAFHQRFLDDVKQKYPELYEEIKKRIDPPIGLGENEPLAFKSHDGKRILLGDNDTPIGRQLNRRVMVHFYTKE